MSLFGMHDRGAEQIMRDGAGGGWTLVTEAIGHDPNDRGGADYTDIVNAGCTPIVRLNNGYWPNGTIPEGQYYGEFAQRCANFIMASKGASIWIIGNEPNLEIERPHNEPISPQGYARCLNRVEQAVHSVVPSARLIPAPIGPWNVQTGDWLVYFGTVLSQCRNIGGIALHTYTHGSDPALIVSDARMTPPYEQRHYHFRAYRDFMVHIPDALRTLPIWITETDQNAGWKNVNSGWVQNAYNEIRTWNAISKDRRIEGMCLYRWDHDMYALRNKEQVLADWRAAMHASPPECAELEKENAALRAKITILQQQLGMLTDDNQRLTDRLHTIHTLSA